MSEPVHQQGQKPAFSEDMLTYLGVFGAVAIAITVLVVAIVVSTPSEAEGVGVELKNLRIAKRQEVNGAAVKLLSEYGKGTAGNYRIPAEEASKILVQNPAAALAAARGVNP